jgi:hypothetical protein
MDQAVEHLPSKQEALNSIPSKPKKKKKEGWGCSLEAQSLPSVCGAWLNPQHEREGKKGKNHIFILYRNKLQINKHTIITLITLLLIPH